MIGGEMRDTTCNLSAALAHCTSSTAPSTSTSTSTSTATATSTATSTSTSTRVTGDERFHF